MSRMVDALEDQHGAVTAAIEALQRGQLAVLPTDTVYGLAADAFSTAATGRLFEAKRRSRRYPLPVLIRSPKQLAGLCTVVPEAADRLMAAYWPGPLTVVVPAEPNLAWDLGDDQGTVAVRMPMDDITLAVVRNVGPLAVTSANLAGQPPAGTIEIAQQQLGLAVEVYVDAGPRRGRRPSTVVDLTRAEPAILREGAVDADEALAVARGELDPTEVADPEPDGEDASEGTSDDASE